MKKRNAASMSMSIPMDSESSKLRKVDQIPPLKEERKEGGNGAQGEVVEKLLAPVDKPGVIRILDRRINTYAFSERSSLYSLLRAWVQDDPDKTPEAPLPLPSCFDDGETDYDILINYLEAKLKEKRPIDQEDFMSSLNSLEGISPSDILSLHTIYYKKMKKIWKMLFAARYGKFRQLSNKSVESSQTFPVISHLAKQLLDAPQSEDQEGSNYSLKQLYQQLQKIKESPVNTTPSTPTR